MSTGTRKLATNPTGVPRPIRGYYSNCVRVSAGPLLFISGQVALDESGRVVGKDDAAVQADLVLRNIERVLAAHNASMTDVVKITVYVTDMRYLDEIAPIRMKYFPTDGPASAIIEVPRLAMPDLKVEIEAVAAVP